MRLLQYLPWLDAAVIEYKVLPLFDDAMLLGKYLHGSYSLQNLLVAYWRHIRALAGRGKFDLVWIEEEALPWLPAWFEARLLRGIPYVLDFDDAIFHNYDLHRYAWVRHFFGRRIDRLMSQASLIVAGNRYLADRAVAAGARWVEVLPTVVDLTRYDAKLEYSAEFKPRIVWIGSPSTVKYLLELAVPLSELALRIPFTLRVIGGGEISMPGVDVESLPWSSERESALIAECDIGIMPLRDTPWEQGKCAYKLIQYMACGLPTVASPIGANREVVIEGETGFFADVPEDWGAVLERMLRGADMRRRFGQNGRARVGIEYCLQQTAPRLVRLLIQAGKV